MALLLSGVVVDVVTVHTYTVFAPLVTPDPQVTANSGTSKHRGIFSV